MFLYLFAAAFSLRLLSNHYDANEVFTSKNCWEDTESNSHSYSKNLYISENWYTTLTLKLNLYKNDIIHSLVYSQ